MQDIVRTNKSNERISVWFSNEDAKPLAIGQKMFAIDERAYMNGYNWDALFNYYLAKQAPDLLEGMRSDPEAGSYAAYYEPTSENEDKAEKFAEIIRFLIENEDELYRIVSEEGNNIKWD